VGIDRITIMLCET